MAWTDPKTWAFQEGVESAELNLHLRDNLNAIGAHVRLRKTADESVTSSVTLQDDDHLTFAIAANEVWIVELMLHCNSGAGGFTLRITAPSGSSGISQLFNDTTAGSVTGAHSNINANLISAGATYTDEPFWIRATVVNGATPGNCLLQWAQGSSNGTASTIKANSHLLAHRIS